MTHRDLDPDKFVREVEDFLHKQRESGSAT